MELLVNRNELSKNFDVEGRFYKIRVKDKTFTCRSQARITRKGITAEKYDAIFILTNPGACLPLDIDYKVLHLDPRNETIPFVEAKSDQTQEQLMRLMLIKEWNKICIINLSDIQSGSMKVFRENLQKADALNYHSHTILTEERNNELVELLQQNKGPIIAGWGTNRSIKHLAHNALSNGNLDKVTGLKHENHPFYYHPKPSLIENRKKWLLNICPVLCK